jgi:hypothetical protein
MPLMISIIEKHCNSLSRRKADSKERVVEIIRGNPLKNKHLIFRIKTQDCLYLWLIILIINLKTIQLPKRSSYNNRLLQLGG